MVRFIVENLRNNNFWRDVLAILVRGVRSAVCCIALWKSIGITKASRIEEGMRLVDPGIYVTDLDAGSGGRSAAASGPSPGCIDDLVALAQVRVVQGIVTNPLHHRSSCDCLQRRSVELHSNRVDRDIVLACNFCPGRICSEPSSELVASSS